MSFYNFEFWKELGKNIADYLCKINVNFRFKVRRNEEIVYFCEFNLIILDNTHQKTSDAKSKFSAF